MNNKNRFRVMAVVLLLVVAETAGAFSFCFSSGGGGGHRSRGHDRYMPAIGFRPDYLPGYPYSPATTGLYTVPAPPMPVQGGAGTGDSTDWHRH